MLLWGTGQKRRRIDHLDVQITFVVVISYDIVYFGWEGFKGGCLCECVCACVFRGVLVAVGLSIKITDNPKPPRYS